MDDISIDGQKISRIYGHVKRTSNSSLDHIAQVYGELRFSDGTKLRNVLVDGIMEGFVQGEEDVTFYVGWFGKAPLIIAVRDEHGEIHEMDTSSVSKVKRALIAQGIQMLLAGIMFAIAGIGLIFLGYSIHLFMKARLLGKLMRLSEKLGEGKLVDHAPIAARGSKALPLAA